MKKLLVVMGVILAAASVWAQQDTTQVEPMDETPIFRVNVVSRSTKAVNYRHRSGSTVVDFKGTSLMAQAGGKAEVDSKKGRLEMNAEVTDVPSASRSATE